MESLKNVVKRSFNLAGLEVRRSSAGVQDDFELGENQVVPDIWRRPIYQEFLPFRLHSSQLIALLGSREETASLKREFERYGCQVVEIEWDWRLGIPPQRISDEAQIVLCKLPMNELEWRVIRSLKEIYGQRVLGLQELILPFTTVKQAQSALTYSVGTLDEIALYYTGQEYFGPLDALDKLFSIAGKSVIEFGPMEGAQTAGLVHLGAKSVTCIEARAESFIKTMVARYAFGWDNVKIVMDDFHNADNLKYGRFDLAFAHGVYYHSIAPFFFFENLMSLSDNVFVGGYIYANPDSSTPGQWETLEYANKKYQVKKIPMGQSYNSGVNKYGYHFNREDLLSVFTDRDYHVAVISDEESGDPWGDRYLRFLASKS